MQYKMYENQDRMNRAPPLPSQNFYGHYVPKDNKL